MITDFILAKKGKMSTEWTIVPGELSIQLHNYWALVSGVSGYYRRVKITLTQVDSRVVSNR